MHRSLRFALAAALAATTHTVFAEALDVSGISIGTQISSARGMLQKVNPEYQVEELRFTNGKIAGLKAVAKKNGASTPNDQFVIMSNDAGIVWFVGRQQNYAQGNRVAFDELEKALVGKYGNPTSTGIIMVSSKRWETYRDGRTHRDKHSPGPCTSGFNAYEWNIVPGTQIGVLKNFAPNCGTLIISEAKVDSNDRMVTQLVTKVIDSKRMFDELNGKELAAQQEKQKQLQQEKAAGNKPKL